MKRTSFIVLALVSFLGAPDGALAQGTITSGTASFDINTFGTLEWSVDFNVGVDHQFGLGFFFRIMGDTAETDFPAPDMQTYVGNVATLTWTNVAGRGFGATLVLTLQASGTTNARLTQQMTINNTGGTPLTIELFHYVDFDLNGTISDSAVLTSPGVITVTDPTPPQSMTYTGPGSSHFQVTAFATLRGLLNDALVTTLADTGLPFGPGDWTGAYQWSTTIPPTSTFVFTPRTTIGTVSVVCGDGTIEAPEVCDDGNTLSCDGCNATCTAIDVVGCDIGGACVADGTVDPGNTCQSCQRAVSTTMYSPRPAFTPCDDGAFCTVSDSCDGASACVGSPRSCDDGRSCTTDSCNEAADLCQSPVTSGCLIGGVCITEGAVDPGNPCQACLGAFSRTMYTPRPAGSTCDDMMFCTTGDVCRSIGGPLPGGPPGTVCLGSPRSCDDGLVCTSDSCNEAADMCQSGPSAASTDCVIGGVCVTDGTVNPMNQCQACRSAVSRTSYSARPAGTTCNDMRFCTTRDACNGASACVGGATLPCNDGLICTADSCSAVTDMCQNTIIAGCLIGGSCVSDGASNPMDQCQACLPATSTSSYSQRPAGSLCNDSLFCTNPDACNGAGLCTGAARSCDDALACTADSCNEAGDRCMNMPTGCLIGGACIATGAVDPMNACQACDPTLSTSAYSPRPVGTMCDDGMFCTVTDACAAGGRCTGAARMCADALACTADSCNETSDMCASALVDGCLIDGMCVADGAVDPTDPCMECDPRRATDAYSPLPLGTRCGDPSCMDSTITPGASCNATGECVPGTPMPCPEGSECEDDMMCAGGCTSDLECRTGFYCEGGMCVPLLPLGDPCDRDGVCESTICADDVCCEEGCTGVCEACNITGDEGACLDHPRDTDPDDECAGDLVCDGMGMCYEMGMDAGVDAGVDGGGGTDSGGGDGARADAGLDAGGDTGMGSGCGCSMGAGARGAAAPFFILLAVLSLVIRRRRR